MDIIVKDNLISFKELEQKIFNYVRHQKHQPGRDSKCFL